MFRINTSSAGKLAEFKKFLGADVEAFSKDLPEPDSDPITVVRFKASQFENVIIDDTSLDIDGADVGVRVRWLLEDLHQHLGKKAVFVCLIGIQRNQKVEIYKGEMPGRIVLPRGNDGFGFNSMFEPIGSNKTYAEYKPDHLNARYLAVQKFLKSEIFLTGEPLKTWTGSFQK